MKYDKGKHDALIQEEARLTTEIAEISDSLNEQYATDKDWEPGVVNKYMMDNQRHQQLTSERDGIRAQIAAYENVEPSRVEQNAETLVTRFMKQGLAGLSEDEIKDHDGRQRDDMVQFGVGESLVIDLATRSDDATGEHGTETETRHALIDRLKAYGGVSRVCRQFDTMTGNDYEMPQIDSASQEGEVLDAQNAQVGNEDLPNIGQVVWTSRTHTSKSIRLTREMLQDNVVDIEGYTQRAIVRRMGRTCDKVATLGLGNGDANGGAGSAGGNRSFGILASAKDGLTAAAQKVITWPELVDMEYQVDYGYLEDEYGEGGFSPEGEGMVGWLFSRDFERIARRMTDGDNRPLWQVSTREGGPNMINGHPYRLSFNLPNVGASATPALFGNFGYFGIRNVLNLEIFRFWDSRTAQFNRIEFIAFMRRDARPIGAVIGGKCEAYAKLTMAA